MRNKIHLLLLMSLCMTGLAAQRPDVTLESPYNTIYTHLYYLQPESYQPREAAKSIYGEPNGQKAETRAIQLKQLLDGKGLYVVISRLPKDPNYVDSLGLARYVLFPKELPQVYVEKINGKWYYSPETAEVVPFLHAELYPFGSDVLLGLAPRWSMGRFLGLALWQWIGMVGLLFLGVLAHKLLSLLLNKSIGTIAKSRLVKERIDLLSIRKIARLLGFVLAIELLRLLLPLLQLPIGLSKSTNLVFNVANCVFLTMLALKIMTFAIDYLRSIALETNSKMDDQLLPLLRHLLRIIIIAIGTIYILNYLNVNVTALIAGVSIGGLAIALAAQDSVKNFIGSLMIFIDKPFHVGDLISLGNDSLTGTVEEIGFRSTRLRSPDASLISIPNGKLADEVVNNLGARVQRRYRTTLSIAYDTPPERIVQFTEGVRDILKKYPSVAPDKTEVHLNAFAASSLDIMVSAYFSVPSWTEELSNRHNIMLDIIRLAEQLGVEFAFPTTKVHIAK